MSSTLHESQSRLWENVVGRSLPFWRWFLPRVQQAFPDQLGDVSLERFHRAVNRVQRSLVRVDADETSYGLHVILRFELEQALVSGQLAVKDLPEAWNTRFEELLGLEVPNDRLGVLQDSHWSTGAFGYFPTYLLGSVLSVQIAEKAREAIPELDEQFERGEFSELHAWLRENLYSLGSRFTPRTRSSAWWAGRSTRSRTFATSPASSTRSPRCSGYAARPKRFSARTRARAASTSRSRGGAVVTSWASSVRVDAATSSIARPKAASFAFDGFCDPLTLRTYWSAAAWISSSVAGGSKLWSVLMFRHMTPA